MTVKLEDIVHDNGKAWIHRDKKQVAYVVYRAGVTHSTSDSAYELTEDGLSLAKARADYLATR